MADEAVLYFDVLGFRTKAAGSGASAVDALTALAQVVSGPNVISLTDEWTHRYALSDSVFLTHADPLHAVRQAAALFLTVTHFTATDDEPVLVRGGIGFGPVKHVRGIFLTSDEPANLVGDGVLEAVRLEQVGLKGPRLFLADALVRRLETQDRQLVRWLLRPTAAPGVWEVLWPLPDGPAALEGDELTIKDLCVLAIRLLRPHGGQPNYGEHYREFLLLVSRSIERAARYVRAKKASVRLALSDFIPRADVEEAVESTSGLPGEFVRDVYALLDSIAARSP